MTFVEKHMNKEDLIAYKNYDNHQYSLIPGVSQHRDFMNKQNGEKNNEYTGNITGKFD